MPALPLLLLAGFALLSSPTTAQGAPGPARVREYRQSFPTYPFSDPDPIPAVGRIYPYFRFDGFTATSRDREWTVVELENDYIRVLILPEIGGKIWAAIEKSTGRPFIYFNRSVKFRDIAMRGPWTSGGIEANYGILGHTPNVSTPVDYTLQRHDDGSVSVVTGALDLLTMTTWRLETRLAPHEASFTTSSTWYNGSSLESPYYTWMTAAIPVSGNLQFVFPGTHWIGHDGEVGTWPVNAGRGRDVSWYEQNDFGGYKSYHVLGATNDFFGAYWHAQDFGMARVSPRDDKPGQKIWIWGLSRQGMIWEDLLTDRDGQYAELQSGRLFNQTAERSTRTPFKHRGFAPHQVDRWTERWMPVAGTQGFVMASAAGALNVRRAGDFLVLALSPSEPIADSLVVRANGRVLLARQVRRAPLQPWRDSVRALGVPLDSVSVVLGDRRLAWDGSPRAATLDRPLEAPRTYDWTSATGLHLRAKERLRQREYDLARLLLDSALARDPHLVPALADRAALALRFMDAHGARQFARAALAIDAYDGAANYHYGLASRRLARTADARDGLEIAAQTMEFRSAAWTELARLWLAEGDERRALLYAQRVLALDAGALDAHAVRVVVARRRRDAAAHAAALAALEAADPLSHLARYERARARGAPDAARALRDGVRSELPEQQLFQVAAWYQDVGETNEAMHVLEAAADHPEALYWRAALLAAHEAPPWRDRPAPDAGTGHGAAGHGAAGNRAAGDGAAGNRAAGDGAAAGRDSAAVLVARANARSPRLVFPFRPEVIQALERALTQGEHWKPRYYLALGYWATGRAGRAGELLAALGDAPDYAPLYAARASLPGRTHAQRVADLTRAIVLDPSEWRYGRRLAERQLAAGDASRAAAVATEFHARFPASYILGLARAGALVAAGDFREADALLDRLRVLPHEGAGEGQSLRREAKLMLAVEAMAGRRWREAQRQVQAAREWPERLGAGRPYDADVDERLEDWLAADVARRSGADTPSARATRARLAEWAAQNPRAATAGGVEGRVLAAWRRLPP